MNHCKNFKQKALKYDLKNRKCVVFSKMMTKMTKYDFIDQTRQNMTFYDLITF